MSEESLLILKMLEDGKITADEAQELLAAVDFTVDSDESEALAPKSRGETRERSSIPGFDQLEDRLDHIPSLVESKLGPSLEKLPSLIENLIGSVGLFGQGHRFEETIEGQFEDGADEVDVVLSSTNGRVTVRGWDQPGYKINLYKMVRAASEDEAREKAQNLAQVIQESTRLDVGTRKGISSGVGMRIEAYLPRGPRYRLDLGSSNGRIIVEDLDAEKLTAHTSNGRIVASAQRIGTADLTTSNGRIEISGAEGDVKARSSNGRVVVMAGAHSTSRELDLKTSNGSITLGLTSGPDLGYRVEARTFQGKIRLACPDMDVKEGEGKKDDRMVFKRRLVAETRNLSQKQYVANISAVTSNGSVSISEIS